MGRAKSTPSQTESAMRFTVLTMFALILVACAPEAPDDRAIPPEDRALPGPSEGSGEGGLADIELCDAAEYRSLVGSSVTSTSFPEGPDLRVFGVNDIVTQDYVPQRTNVVYDEQSIITRIYCG